MTYERRVAEMMGKTALTLKPPLTFPNRQIELILSRSP